MDKYEAQLTNQLISLLSYTNIDLID